MRNFVRVIIRSGLEGNGTDEFRDDKEHEVDVPLEEFAPKFGRWYAANKTERLSTRSTAWFDFCLSFFPGLESNTWVGRRLKLVYPSLESTNGFTIKKPGGWIALFVAPDTWMFWYERSQDTYEWIQIPDGCEVEDNGTINCEYETYKYRTSPRLGLSEPDDEGWPWVLLNPRAWIVREQLKNVLDRRQSSFLTMLATTNHQPCRGTGIHLKGELEQVLRMFTEALTGDRF